MSLPKLKRRRGRYAGWKLLVLAVVIVSSGLYMLLLTAAPYVVPIDKTAVETALKNRPAIKENRLYIPEMGVNVPINEIVNGNDAQALFNGAAHRAAQSGNPKDGGNFVLAAHRFSLGITPGNVVQKSPFFHIDRLKVKDLVYVDWLGERYTYRINSLSSVAPTQVSIEARTALPQLTFYSCGLGGERDNRIVAMAKPVE
ncbi:sortase [Candidatus Saccharibacteria bacterium]|jgi:sortase A|nr:sortase [Candidatus Saccharibacteria bacterium]